MSLPIALTIIQFICVIVALFAAYKARILAKKSSDLANEAMSLIDHDLMQKMMDEDLSVESIEKRLANPEKTVSVKVSLSKYKINGY